MKALFLGNRPNVRREAQKLFYVKEIKEIKEETIKRIQASTFDVLLSNGYPYKLPITELKKKGQWWINLHPSYLPYCRGYHAIDCLYRDNHTHYGATMHFMTDELDAGPIIYQERRKMVSTSKIYQKVFELEARVFVKGIKLLLNDSKFKGTPQDHSKATYA